MAMYQGHRSWNAWNVSLWINNDYGTYKYAQEMVTRYGAKKAARMLAADWENEKTPDGGKFNFTCIYEAIRDINS